MATLSESYSVAISSLLLCKVVQSPLNCLATPFYKEPQDWIGQNENDEEAYCSAMKEEDTENFMLKDRGEERKDDESEENIMVPNSTTSNESRNDSIVKSEVLLPEVMPKNQSIERTVADDDDTSTLPSEEEQKEPEDNTTESSYYYISVSDDSSRTSTKYRFFYDDAASKSTLVSRTNRLQKDTTSRLTSTIVNSSSTFQKNSKTKRGTRKSRFDELYEYGKQKKRSELKKFQQQKPDPDSSILRRGGSHSTILYSSSFEEKNRSAMSTKKCVYKNKGSSHCNRYIRTSTPSKRNQDVKMKQQRETANVSGKSQEDFLVRPASIRNRSYSASRGRSSSRTRNHLSTLVQNKHRSLTPRPQGSKRF